MNTFEDYEDEKVNRGFLEALKICYKIAHRSSKEDFLEILSEEIAEREKISKSPKIK